MHKGNDLFKIHERNDEERNGEKVKRAEKNGIRMASEKRMEEEKKNLSV